MQIIIKSMTIRLFPTKEQERMMWNHVHAARFIWNYMLRKQIDLKKSGEKRLSVFDMSKELTPLKKENQYLWLNSVSNATLQSVNAHLGFAFKRMKDGGAEIGRAHV